MTTKWPVWLLGGMLVLLISCKDHPSPGPFFGNGMLNGWADQHSVVLWTRLTKNREMNRSGFKFLIPSAEEVRMLDKQADPLLIQKAQIPEGATLEKMEGACPGSAGEVRLVYFPAGQPEKKTVTGWIPVDTTKNFTFQWKLNELTPGTTWQVKMYARKNSGTPFPAGKRRISERNPDLLRRYNSTSPGALRGDRKSSS